MSEESTTPDLVERWRQTVEAFARRDFDAALSFFAPDAVWETVGLGTTFEGHVAIRGFWEDWYDGYEDIEAELEEIVDHGSGVVSAVIAQKARLVGSSGAVRYRSAIVGVWVGGVVVRLTSYPDINEGRAAAERLAEGRG